MASKKSTRKIDTSVCRKKNIPQNPPFSAIAPKFSIFPRNFLAITPPQKLFFGGNMKGGRFILKTAL